MKRGRKEVCESEIIQIHFIKQKYLDDKGKLQQAWLMHWICEVAAKIAMRRSGSDVVVRTVDSQTFYTQIHFSGIIELQGRMIDAGETQMEIQVDAFVKNEWENYSEVNRAYVMLDVVDERCVTD